MRLYYIFIIMILVFTSVSYAQISTSSKDIIPNKGIIYNTDGSVTKTYYPAGNLISKNSSLVTKDYTADIILENNNFKLQANNNFWVYFEVMPVFKSVDTNWDDLLLLYPNMKYKIIAYNTSNGIKFDINLTNEEKITIVPKDGKGPNTTETVSILPPDLTLKLNMVDDRDIKSTEYEIERDGIVFKKDWKLIIADECKAIIDSATIYLQNLSKACLDPLFVYTPNQSGYGYYEENELSRALLTYPEIDEHALTASNLNSMSFNDGTSFDDGFGAGAANELVAVKIRFNITERPEQVINFTVFLKHKGAASIGDLYIQNITAYIVNYTSQTYIKFGEGGQLNNGTWLNQTYNASYLNTNLSQLINTTLQGSNLITVVSWMNGSSAPGGAITQLMVDYVELNVTSDITGPNITNITVNRSYSLYNKDVMFNATLTDDYNVTRAYVVNNFNLTDKYIQNQSNRSTYIRYGKTTSYGQTFSIPESHYLRQVCFNMSRSTGTVGETQVRLYNTLSNLPTGNNLTFPAIIPAFQTGTATIRCANFSQPYKLSANTIYAVTLMSGTSTAVTSIRVEQAGNLYSNWNTIYQTGSNTSAWTPSINDLQFWAYTSDYENTNITISPNVQAFNSSINISTLYAKTDFFTWKYCGLDWKGNANCMLPRNYYVLMGTLDSDSTQPYGAFLSPPNNSVTYGITNLEVTASDNYGVDYVTFMIKNTTMNYTNITGCEQVGSPYNCSWDTSLYNTNAIGYDIMMVPVDLNKNANVSILPRHFVLDNEIPRLNNKWMILVSTNRSSTKTGDKLQFYVNVTDNIAINTTLIDLDEVNGTYNANMSRSAGTIGNNNWSVWATNSTINTTFTGYATAKFRVYDNTTVAKNVLTSSFVWMMDNIKPTWENISISNSTPIFNATNLTFTIHSMDNWNLSYYIFESNLSNNTLINRTFNFTGGNPLTDYASVTNNVTTGNRSFRFYVYDDAGNLNLTSWNNVWIQGPVQSVITVSLKDPTENYISTFANQTFSYNYTARNATTCGLVLNSAVNESVNNTLANTTSYFYKNLTDGSWTWSVKCTDQFGVSYDSETRSISVDNVPPTVTLTAPLNYSWVRINNPTMNSTLHDDNSLVNATGYLWNSSNVLINYTYFYISAIDFNLSYNYTFPSEGLYYWNVKACNELSSCSFQSSNNTYRYDAVATEIPYQEYNYTNISRINSVKENSTCDSYPSCYLLTNDSALKAYYTLDLANKTIYDYDMSPYHFASIRNRWDQNTSAINCVIGNCLENISNSTQNSIRMNQSLLIGWDEASIFGWGKADTNADAVDKLLIDWEGSGGDPTKISRASTERYVVYFQNTSNLSVTATYAGTFPNTDWYHLGSIYRHNTTYCTIQFINGTEKASNCNGNTALITASFAANGFYIGSDSLGALYPDNIMVFDRALTDNEAMAVSNTQYSFFPYRGTQIFDMINLSSSGSIVQVNVTLNTTQYNGSHLQVGLIEYNDFGVNYQNSSLYNFTAGWQDNSLVSMNTSEYTHNFSVIIVYNSNEFASYTPTIQDDLIIKFRTFGAQDVDTILPVFTAAANITVTNGTSVYYDFNATDASGISSFWINETTLFQITIDGNFSNKSVLNEGLTWINLSVNDTVGNNNSILFFVNITPSTPPDTTAPYLYIPANLTVNYLVPVLAQFNATDGVAVDDFFINYTSQFTINSSGHIYNSTPLPVNTFDINVSVNDTSNNINWTIYKVTINKIASSTNMLISGTTPINYGTISDFVGSETNIGDSDLIYTSNWTNGIFANGTYVMNYSNEGGQNYSAGYVTKNMSVLKNTGDCKVIINTTSPVNYLTDINISTNCTSAYLLKLNGTTITNATQHSLSVGNWNISVQRLDYSNYTNTYNDSTFTINKIPANNSMQIAGTTPITFGTTSDFIGSESNTGDSDLVYVENWTNQIYSVGTHDFNYSTQGGANYTAGYKIKTLTVNSNTGDCKVVLNNTGPLDFLDDINISTNCTSAYTLYLNGTSISNATIYKLGAGTWNATVKRTDQANYSNYYNETLFTINKGNSSVLMQITGTTPIEYYTTSDFASSETNTYDADCSYVLNDSNKVFGVGTVTWKYSTTGCWNWTEGNTTKDLTITKNTSLVLILSANPAWTAPNLTLTTITGSNCPSQLQCNLSRNGTYVTNPDAQTLAVGDYFYKYNTSGNANYSESQVNNTLNITAIPDTTGPVFTDIANITLMNGTSLSYDINATDATAVDWFWINDTSNFNITKNGVLTNKTNLNISLYWINVSVNDTVGNNNSILIFVNNTNVPDTTNPTFTDVANITVTNGTSVIYDINASDNIAVDWFWINDTTNFNITKDGLLTNKTLLSISLYWLNISINDTSNNNASILLFVNNTAVPDTSSPTFTDISNITKNNITSLNYDINASDPSNLDWFWINDTTNFNITKNGVLTNKTVLIVSEFWLNVSVNDTVGNNNSILMFVNNTAYIDIIPPTFTDIANITVTNGTSVYYDFNATDSYSGISWFWINYSGIFNITQSGVFTNLTILNVTTYWLNLSVNDTAGNNNSILFYVINNPITTPSGGGTSSGGSAPKSTDFFSEMKISTNKKKYTVLEKVNLTVEITNKAHFADKNAKLYVYMRDKDGKVISNTTYLIDEVPPSCDAGFYNDNIDQCEMMNGEVFEPFRYMNKLELSFPVNASLGEYPITAELVSTQQPRIKDETIINMYAAIKNWWLIGLIILGLIVMWRYKKIQD